MKKQMILVGLISLVFFASGGNAAADCNLSPCDAACQTDSCGKYLTEKSIFESKLFENQLIGKKSKSRISFHGWMLTGITVNNHGATNAYGPDASAYDYNNRRTKDGTLIRPGYNDASGNSYVLMLEQPTEWKLNHLWLGAKRELTNRFDWGFQADFIYGTDARYTRNWGDRTFDYSWGSGDYFPSFPQLFATLGTKDLFVKVGKFSGGFAYEGLPAPREFFYSHANICYGRPFVAQGAMVEWHPNKKWMLTGGWLSGTYNSFDNPYGDNGFLGKASYQLTKNTSLTYKIFYNAKGGAEARQATDCLNTLIFTWKINKNWFYMGEIAYTDNNNKNVPRGHAFGVNNHLIRTFTDKFSVGFRGEYHHSYRSFFDNPNVTEGEGGDIWSFTLAAHYKINPKTTVRPEMRYDIADYKNGYRPFGGDASKKDQLCGGVSLIVMF